MGSMSRSENIGYAAAVQDFHRARQRASLRAIVTRLEGRTDDLLSYDQVRRLLHPQPAYPQELRDIPIDAIIGSVDRYTDFTRNFLPRREGDVERWARVKAAVTSLKGLPPIEVIQVGEAYFVLDGHHRVSVAREVGAPTIQAYVRLMTVRTPLTPDTDLNGLILKAGQSDFLEQTQLDTLRPDADLTLTIAGRYRDLKEHIEVHRYYMGLEQSRPVSLSEAAADWHDKIYLPVVQAIRHQGILRQFPGRSEADLYLWLARHRAELEKELGLKVRLADAATDLVARFGAATGTRLRRWGTGAVNMLLPGELEPGPPPGVWRDRQERRGADKMFQDLLVSLSPEDQAWAALDQALWIAGREGGQVHGLHILEDDVPQDVEQAAAMRLEFERRCHRADVPNTWTVDSGKVALQIAERAGWSDLVVVHLAHPPQDHPGGRWASGVRTLLQRSGAPVLFLPGAVTRANQALLAYDDSVLAREGLYLCAYLAGAWGTRIVVASIEGGRAGSAALGTARMYLQRHGIQTQALLGKGARNVALLDLAAEHECDLIVMGGYGSAPVVEVMRGSTVDGVLRQSELPVLVCR
jgi:nucleotide-binding universal stress UspA family protein